MLERGRTASGGGWTYSGLDDDDADWLAFLSQITTFALPSCLLSSLNPINNSKCLFSLFTRAISLIAVQHILRLLNTNVDGKRKVMYALTEIKGVGRRYANIVCKKADVDLNKRCVRAVYHCQNLLLTCLPERASSTQTNWSDW